MYIQFSSPNPGVNRKIFLVVNFVSWCICLNSIFLKIKTILRPYGFICSLRLTKYKKTFLHVVPNL